MSLWIWLSTSCEWNHTDLSFCDWLSSLRITSSSFPHAVACVRVSFLFFFFFDFSHGMWKFPGLGPNPCHSSDVSHCSQFPFFLRLNTIPRYVHSTFGLFFTTDGHLGVHLLTVVNNPAVDTCVQTSVQVSAFNPFGYIPGSGIAGSYDNSIFNVGENCHTVVHSSYLYAGFFFVFLSFLGLLPRHMEVPRLWVYSEL